MRAWASGTRVQSIEIPLRVLRSSVSSHWPGLEVVRYLSGHGHGQGTTSLRDYGQHMFSSRGLGENTHEAAR